MVQIAQDWPQTEQQDERSEHRRQDAVRGLRDPEAHHQHRRRHRELDREPAHRAGDGREPHERVEGDRHQRRIGEEHPVVDVHPAPELEDLGPPPHERAAMIGGFLVIECRRDEDYGRPKRPENPARESIAAFLLAEFSIQRWHCIPLPWRRPRSRNSFAWEFYAIAAESGPSRDATAGRGGRVPVRRREFRLVVASGGKEPDPPRDTPARTRPTIWS